mgnify:CR=1 FL=1
MRSKTSVDTPWEFPAEFRLLPCALFSFIQNTAITCPSTPPPFFPHPPFFWPPQPLFFFFETQHFRNTTHQQHFPPPPMPRKRTSEHAALMASTCERQEAETMSRTTQKEDERAAKRARQDTQRARDETWEFRATNTQPATGNYFARASSEARVQMCSHQPQLPRQYLLPGTETGCSFFFKSSMKTFGPDSRKS